MLGQITRARPAQSQRSAPLAKLFCSTACGSPFSTSNLVTSPSRQKAISRRRPPRRVGRRADGDFQRHAGVLYPLRQRFAGRSGFGFRRRLRASEVFR
jgi:hypothetical protein